MSLFPATSIPEYLIELKYQGPSFDGVMEIGALGQEIVGLEKSLQIILQTLAKHNRIDFDPQNSSILVQAFERGSFKKRIKLIIKGLDKHPSIVNVAVLVVMIIQAVPQYTGSKLRDMSPSLIAEIGDQVKVDLLKNEEFKKSLADIVRPLSNEEDALVCSTPQNGSATLTYSDKREFLDLAGEIDETDKMEGDQFENLRGRINRVDLDATKRHIGFKVNSEGSSISATLSGDLRTATNMNSLLGKWVEISGVTTYQGGLRSHIEIKEIKIIEQQAISF